MEKTPVTFRDILAAVDPAARHAMDWGKTPVMIRGVTVREFLRLLPIHPTLALAIDPVTSPDGIDALIAVLGLPAMAAFASVGTDIPAAKLLKLGHLAVSHAFLSVAALTFVFRDVGDFFVIVRKPPSSSKGLETIRRKKPDAPESEDIDRGTRLMATVRDAVEYTARTSRDGLDLTPIALEFSMRTLAEIDRGNRISTHTAVAAAMGDAKAHEHVGAV